MNYIWVSIRWITCITGVVFFMSLALFATLVVDPAMEKYLTKKGK